MPLLRWKDEYATGITAADYEHRKLIQDINGLYDRWAAQAATQEFFSGVLKCMAHHFTIEERLMAECAYDRRAEHTADHKALMKEIAAIRARAESGDEDFAAPLAAILERWLADHIGTHDVRMFRELGLAH